jgi:cyclic pyranopterin phosphate synthase
MKLSHLDEEGRARMVDIGEKKLARRRARAEGRLFFGEPTRKAVEKKALPKGNPFEVARIAGIQAAKRTDEWIPLCHSICLDFVNVEIALMEDHFLIRSEVSCRWSTGVEMEALTAVAASALTLYDMCKAVDRGLLLKEVRLVEKSKVE